MTTPPRPFLTVLQVITSRNWKGPQTRLYTYVEYVESSLQFYTNRMCFFLSCCTIVIYSISSCSEERFQWDLTAIILDCELLYTYYSLEILAHTKWNEICGSLKSIHNKDSILDKETMISKVNMSHRNFEYKIRKVCMLSYSNGIKTTATHLCLHCQLLLTAV